MKPSKKSSLVVATDKKGAPTMQKTKKAPPPQKRVLGEIKEGAWESLLWISIPQKIKMLALKDA